jgi:hypothetical protein
MKMKQVSVTWEKTVEATVFVPEDMDERTLRRVLNDAAYTIDSEGWNVEWVALSTTPETVEVPDAECVLVEVASARGFKYHTPVVGSRFSDDAVLVVDDARESIVNPEDATWWLAPSPKGAEE